MAADLVGKTIAGRYQLDRLIGSGGMGAVYRGVQSALARPVAVKVLHSQLMSNPEAVDRFLGEARLAARISHPNVVQMVDFGRTSEDDIFFVMEFLRGETLDHHLQRVQRLSIQAAVGVARDVASAAAYAHEMGVIHRDLKPGNIFLTLDLGVGAHTSAKVLDFGIAKAILANEARTATTGAGALLGSPGYMSPEQLQSARDVDAKTDVFSLGCILYEMVCGRRPFVGDTYAEVIAATITKEPVSPRAVMDDLPDALEQLILRALHKNPKERIQTMAEFHAALVSLRLEKGAPSISLHDTAATDDVGLKLVTSSPEVTQMTAKEAPQGFFGATLMNSFLYFKDNDVRLEQVRDTFTFYRDHLNREYNELSRQMTTAHTMWLACVGLGFAMLLFGLSILIFAGPKQLMGGGATALSSTLVYFIVRIFQRREDHYRSLRSEKTKYLEYGNNWLLLIQSIDAISDSHEKMQQQVRLVSVLTQKLQGGTGRKAGVGSH